jgi:sugar-specific transcriptional regulator TrmB
MKKDLVNKLSDFGFTVNQAKVYVSIVQSGSTCVSKISELTRLHRQDIYKILPKLEKMGLITKTVSNPTMIEALPVENALVSLVSVEKEKANERISRLEANQKELVHGLNEQQARKHIREEDRRFILLTTDAEIENMARLSFKKMMTEFDWVTNLELLRRQTCFFSECFETLATAETKIRIIVESLKNEDLDGALKNIAPKSGDFMTKLIIKRKSLPYQIIDHREVWVSRKQLTEHGFPCVLWTNSRNITEFYDESFKNAWNSRRAISIYP